MDEFDLDSLPELTDEDLDSLPEVSSQPIPIKQSENNFLDKTLLGTNEAGKIKSKLDVAKDIALATPRGLWDLIRTGGGVIPAFESGMDVYDENIKQGNNPFLSSLKATGQTGLGLIDAGSSLAGGVLGGVTGQMIGQPIKGGMIGNQAMQTAKTLASKFGNSLAGTNNLASYDKEEEEGYKLLKNATTQEEKNYAQNVINLARQSRENFLNNDSSLDEFNKNQTGIIEAIGSNALVPETAGVLRNIKTRLTTPKKVAIENNIRNTIATEDPNIASNLANLKPDINDPFYDVSTTGQKVKSPVLRALEQGLDTREMSNFVNKNDLIREGIEGTIKKQNLLKEEEFNQRSKLQELEDSKINEENNLKYQDSIRQIEQAKEQGLLNYDQAKVAYEQAKLEFENNKTNILNKYQEDLNFAQQKQQSATDKFISQNPNLDTKATEAGSNILKAIQRAKKKSLTNFENLLGGIDDQKNIQINFTNTMHKLGTSIDELKKSYGDKSPIISELVSLRNKIIKGRILNKGDANNNTTNLINAKDIYSTVKGKVNEQYEYAHNKEIPIIYDKVLDDIIDDIDKSTNKKFSKSIENYRKHKKLFDEELGDITKENFGSSIVPQSSIAFKAISTPEKIKNILDNVDADDLPSIQNELRATLYDEMNTQNLKDGQLDFNSFNKWLNKDRGINYERVKNAFSPEQLAIFEDLSNIKLDIPQKPNIPIFKKKIPLKSDFIQTQNRPLKPSNIKTKLDRPELSQIPKLYNTPKSININDFANEIVDSVSGLTEKTINTLSPHVYTGGFLNTGISVNVAKLFNKFSREKRIQQVKQTIFNLAKDENFAKDFFNPEKTNEVKQGILSKIIDSTISTEGIRTGMNMYNQEPESTGLEDLPIGRLYDDVSNNVKSFFQPEQQIDTQNNLSNEVQSTPTPILYNQDLSGLDAVEQFGQVQPDFSQGIPIDSTQFDINALNHIIKNSKGTANEIAIVKLAQQYGVAELAGNTNQKRKLIDDMSRIAPHLFEKGMGIDNKIVDPIQQEEYLKILHQKMLRDPSKITPALYAKQYNAFKDSEDNSIIELDVDQNGTINDKNLMTPREYSY